MTPLVVGTREDVAGFALAGVDGVVCATPGEAGQAIARAGADTLVIVSAEFGPEVPHGGPLAIVLPLRT
jgi:vacuolar-type H+-ATPase subunit F/Vma7